MQMLELVQKKSQIKHNYLWSKGMLNWATNGGKQWLDNRICVALCLLQHTKNWEK